MANFKVFSLRGLVICEWNWLYKFRRQIQLTTEPLLEREEASCNISSILDYETSNNMCRSVKIIN